MGTDLSYQSRRWSILTLGVVGWAAAMLVLAMIGSTLAGVGESLAELGLVRLLLVTLILLVALIFSVCRGRRAAFLGGRHFWRHPPLWTAAVVGIVVHSLVLILTGPAPSGSSVLVTLTNLWMITGFVACCGVVAALIDGASNQMHAGVEAEGGISGPRSIESMALDADELDRWLAEDDQPIRLPAHDLFGHARVARRIARRLAAANETTILLRGPKGSGKTSILRLVEHYIEHPLSLGSPGLSAPSLLDSTSFNESMSPLSISEVRLVHVSAWEFEDTRALLAGVLSAIVSETHKVADAYDLVGVPAAYLAAVSSASGVLSSVSSLLVPDDDPDGILNRISRILGNVDVRVVVWLDDLERFREGRDQTDEPIKALLTLVRSRPNLSFVLAEGAAGTSAGGFDYPKLCSFAESVPRCDPLRVAEVVHAFRVRHRSRFGTIDPAIVEDHEQFGEVGFVERVFAHDPGVMTIWGAVGNILNTPRQLKMVLRRVAEVWSQLNGEVNFNDLLLCTILRESDYVVKVGPDGAGYSVIDLIDSNLSWLRKRATGQGETERGGKPTPAQSAIENLLDARTIPEGVLLSYLFATADTRKRPQSVALQGPSDYWARIRSESIDDEEPDQFILAMIDRFNAPATSEGSGAFKQELVDQMMVRGAMAGKVTQFGHRLGPGGVHELLSLVLQRVLADPEAVQRDEHRTPDAFVNLAILVNEVWLSPKKRLALVRSATSKAMPLDLSLVYAIEYWLVKRPGQGNRGSPDSDEDRAAVAAHIAEAFVTIFSGSSGPAQLVAALRPGPPWALSWVLNRKWDRRPAQSTLGADFWTKVGLILTSAAELDPRIAGTALACMLSDGDMHFGGVNFDEESGQVSGDQKWVGSFNETRARTILDKDFARGMRVLAGVPLDGHDGQTAEQLRAVIEAARDWLADHGATGTESTA